MKLKEIVQDMQRLASQDLKGGDVELVLFDRETGREFRLDPDTDTFDFEITRGDGQLLIEFN